jgi:hypothetical protein
MLLTHPGKVVILSEKISIIGTHTAELADLPSSPQINLVLRSCASRAVL